MQMENKILNCPNCGAVRTGAKCEYCGTVFEIEDEEQLDVVTLYADGEAVCQIARRAPSPAKATAEAFRKFAEHL